MARQNRNRSWQSPPHVKYEAARKWDAERDAFEAALEAKYGMPYDELPSALRVALPEHPSRTNARRYDRLGVRTWRTNWAQRRHKWRVIPDVGVPRGWRVLRRVYLREVEEVRQAEIAVRAKRFPRPRRTDRPKPKNALVIARKAVARRELRDGAW